MPSTCSTTFADFVQRAGLLARGAPLSHVGAAMPAKVLQRSGRGRPAGIAGRCPPKPARTTAKGANHVKALHALDAEDDEDAQDELDEQQENEDLTKAGASKN